MFCFVGSTTLTQNSLPPPIPDLQDECSMHEGLKPMKILTGEDEQMFNDEDFEEDFNPANWYSRQECFN